MNSKVYTLSDAIAKFVQNGDHVCFGGFTTNRKPYAAVYEIMRQGQKDFVVEAGPAGGDWDLLIGEGRVKAYINCYTANSGVTNVSRRFRSAIEKGELIYEDYSQDAIMLMLHAASLGLPYLPVRLMMGSDLTDKWGISKEVRKTIEKLPDDKFVYVDNPFNPGEKIVALPVPKLDLAIIHAQKASPDGTVTIEGDEFHDVDIAVAAKKVIVTCEELVSNEEIRKDPSTNSIPPFCVDAVVHAPYGAHPSQCYNYYDYDNPFLKEYDVASKTQEAFDEFNQKWVYSVKDHQEYLDKLGASRLVALNNVPGLGYAPQAKSKEEK
ncbi:glutaconate CoA-transferase subunit A [Anaerophilus nitritogenes]|uniref:glutaconate CoA-transferase subunit A n=1 Tax=Anaerophilus nitritogenes TaxID=2498136 RepID=UPI00101B90E0|nr:glutaconate CoA-transferase subunit A [Anaerophilus nitritogenes]